jgi:drug/metabolite transporter (DMT)-like permease
LLLFFKKEESLFFLKKEPKTFGTRRMPRTRLDTFAIVTLVVLTAMWGVHQVSVKVAIVGGFPPAVQAGLRSLVAALCVFAWIAVRQGRAGVAGLLARPTLLPGAVIALLFASEFLAIYHGIHFTTASRGVMFIYTAPFFTALGAHLFVRGERLRWIQVLGLLIAFSGVGIAFANGLLAGSGGVLGDLLCLLGGALWGATTVVVKAVPALARAPAAKLLWLQLAGSAPVLLLAAGLSGELWPLPAPSALAWACWFYQTVIVAFGSYLVWFWLVVTYPAGRVASFTFLGPVFGILAGVVLQGDPLSWALLAGLVAISIGLRLVNTKGAAP